MEGMHVQYASIVSYLTVEGVIWSEGSRRKKIEIQKTEAKGEASERAR